MEYLGDIRVLVDFCLKVLFQYELYDGLSGKNSFMLFYYELFYRSIRKNNFEVVSYPTIISTFVLRYQWLWSDSLLHVEGLLYDLSMLLLLRELALVKVRTLGLVPIIAIPFTLTFTTCYLAVFIISDYKNLYLPSILHLYHHLFSELVHLYNLPLYWVCCGLNRLFFIWLQGCLRETIFTLRLPRIYKPRSST